MSTSEFSRRDFLKLSSYGLMGMILPDTSWTLPALDDFANLQGRVTDRTLWSYESPDFKSKRKKIYWRDLVIPIRNTTISDDEKAYNRVWYETDERGYIYSGSVQPVRTILNTPETISLKG